MNRFALPLIALFFSVGCASTTVIRSEPSGATVRSLKGQVLGQTPYRYKDRAIIGNTEQFTIEKKGYASQDLEISKDNVSTPAMVGSIVGGLFAFPFFAGILWSSDYEPQYKVELEPKASDGEVQEEEEEAPRPAKRAKPNNRRRDRVATR